MLVTDYDERVKFMGEWGPFQKRTALLLCLSIIPNGWTGLSVVFLADTPPHHCVIPPNDNISAEWRNHSIPLEEDNGVMRYSRCTRYKLDVIQRLSDNGYVPGASFINRIVVRRLYELFFTYALLINEAPGVDVNVTGLEQESCKDGWEYDREIYISTIVSEWDLVCNDAWKVPMTSSIFFFGLLTGSFISGQLSDRFGRKIVLFATLGVQTVFTFFQIFSTSWFMYSALFFIVGFGDISNYVAAFVLGTELLSPRIRVIYSTAGVCFFFAFGYMVLPLMAFLIRDWRMLVVAIAVPGVFYFPAWWLIPESPRWLLSQGRVKEAEAILRGAARRNGVTAPEAIFAPLQVEDDKGKCKHHTICDLVKSKDIRWITMTLSLVWMFISIGYYALSLNTSNLYGDRYLNCFFSAAVEVPAYMLSWLLFRFFSRRLTLFAMLFIGGAVLLLTQLIPRDLNSLSTALKMMGKFGITMAYSIVYAFTAELYPTVLRTTAVTTCSMSARLGSIFAPYFVYLGNYYKSLPYLLMGGLSVLGALLSILLPETHGLPLPETINDMQTIPRCKKRQSSSNVARDTAAVENALML